MIQFFIPCSECSEHYKEHYENNIGAINWQMSLIEYFFTLHNIVNKRNNKKELKREEFIDLHFYKL